MVVVAHPDDETIWMGGFILKHPEIDWTIFSLCRASDPDRAPKFRRLCRALGAQAIITDLNDEGRLNEKQAPAQVKKIIKQKIGKKKFFARGGPARLHRQASGWNYIFTHGANGEYGHPRHKFVHLAVKKMVAAGNLKAGNVLCFNYKKISKYKLKPKKNSNIKIRLSPSDFKKKKNLMTQIYGFNPDGIDAGYCTNPEAFKILR